MILVKSLILIDPKDDTPVKELQLRRMPVVNEDTPLYQMLDMFQQGKSILFFNILQFSFEILIFLFKGHMAIIIDSSDCITSKGIITLEDVVEELIGVSLIKIEIKIDKIIILYYSRRKL